MVKIIYDAIDVYERYKMPVAGPTANNLFFFFEELTGFSLFGRDCNDVWLAVLQRKSRMLLLHCKKCDFTKV